MPLFRLAKEGIETRGVQNATLKVDIIVSVLKLPTPVKLTYCFTKMGLALP